MHDHLFYTAAGGRAAQLGFTGPRLYLASGVTTIRTTGGRAPYAEINTKDAIDEGRVPGPRIHLTAPYITGRPGGAYMDVVESPEAARRFVAYWAAGGRRVDQGLHGHPARGAQGCDRGGAPARLKVTGHLCSVTFAEAVDLGIDNLEHGLLHRHGLRPSEDPRRLPLNSHVRVGARSPTARRRKR